MSGYEIDGENVVGKSVDANGNTVYQIKEPIRKLNQEERDFYGKALRQAVAIVPPFRDIIGLLSPYFDYTAQTAYTDKSARVGLGPWFFTLGRYTSATVILHEAMHVLNNHFQRADLLNMKPELRNLSGDLEINSGLNMLPNADISVGILPNKDPFEFENNLSMEQYYHLLNSDEHKEKLEQLSKEQNCEKCNPKDNSSESDSNDSGKDDSSEGDGEQGDGQPNGQGGTESNDGPECTCGGKSSGSGSGQPNGKTNGNKSCDQSTEERELAADEAGIDKASNAEREIAKKNTLARIVEHQKSTGQRGDGALNAFLKITELRMNPPKIKWQSILNKSLSTSRDTIVRGRVDYSYRRSNRRLSGSEFIFPGMVRYIPSIMFAFDTSGSMGNEDYFNLLTEVEAIIKSSSRGKDPLKVFPIDTDIKGVQKVKSVKDVKIVGGGGTDMSSAVKYINELSPKEKPDIFILATDGYTDWTSYEQRLIDSNRKYSHILLITTKGGYKSVPESLKKLCTVIDISNEDDNRPEW